MVDKRFPKQVAHQIRRHVALELDDHGWSRYEIAKLVDRHPDTVRDWLRQMRGPKVHRGKLKAKIEKLLSKGQTVQQVRKATGASKRHILAVKRALEEATRTRRSPKQVADDFFAGDRSDWDRISLKDYKARCQHLLRRTVFMVNDKPSSGIKQCRQIQEEIRGRRNKLVNTSDHRDLTCLLTLAINLEGAGHQMANALDLARDCLDHAWQEGGDCLYCSAECYRQQGWLQNHLRDIWAKLKPELAAKHAKLSAESFSRAIALYQRFPKYRGHSSHNNGLASTLQGRSVLQFYCKDYMGGLKDAERALDILDPRISPGLVVPIVHTTAMHLSKLPGRKPEAKALVQDLMADMKPEKTVRYAKVLWLHGQLEAAPKILTEARHILIGEAMGREVAVISMDILACDQPRFRQAESIERLGRLSRTGELKLASFLDDVGARELATLYRQLRQGLELSPAGLRRIRKDLGGDSVMPALLLQDPT